jgi:hypothetical protein
MGRAGWILFGLVFVVSACTPGPTSTPSPSPVNTEEESAAPTRQPASPTAEPGDSQGEADADVTFVRAVREEAENTWTFQVTVEHPDTGWEDYADGWDVVLPDGKVVKPDPEDPFTRLLLHPHVDEQPFTRSQRGIAIPEGVNTVRVRAHDLVDGWGGKEVTVDLTAGSGENFEVVR